MVEEVYSIETEAYALRVCRDGRIMIRIEDLEREEDPDHPEPIEETVRTWGKYLDYLNAFYLLLDSSTIEIISLGYFNLHEITNRDAFRVRYEDGRSVGENIAIESIASVFQMGRYLSSYQSGIPIEHDPKLSMRQVIPIEVLEDASGKFAEVVASPGLEKLIASFAKSLSEYKIGNYETSVVIAWFIVERGITRIWEKHIKGMNVEFSGGKKRINRERRDFLTGRDFSMSIVSNMLELGELLPFEVFEDIDTVRGLRNKIVHGHDYQPDAENAQLALKTAQWMITHEWGFGFTPNTGYSVSGI